MLWCLIYWCKRLSLNCQYTEYSDSAVRKLLHSFKLLPQQAFKKENFYFKFSWGHRLLLDTYLTTSTKSPLMDWLSLTRKTPLVLDLSNFSFASSRLRGPKNQLKHTCKRFVWDAMHLKRNICLTRANTCIYSILLFISHPFKQAIFIDI